MADFEELKAAIREDIRENDAQLITGEVMQATLVRMVDDINAEMVDKSAIDALKPLIYAGL
jgi:ABC-type metal ion transport system substrate-binding protein